MRTGAARWKRKDVSGVLTAAARDVCGDDIRRENWAGVQDALAAHIAARPARFVLDPSSSTALRDQVLARWPGAVRDAASRADRVLDGAYDLLGYRGVRARDGRVDWHADPVHGRHAPRVFYADVPFLSPEIGDHKIIWELNRHQHWLQLGRALWLTGDSRYARGICSELESWLAHNQPYVGINWASMLEIGFRAISWTWALHCLLGIPNPQRPTPNEEHVGGWELGVGSSPWLVDMLLGLDRQLTHVERHLSYYFSPNTHLTGEALALYVAGTALPELAASHRWVETGRRILLHEIDRQILADGGHVERSTHYQRYTLDFYLLAALTARLGRDEAAGRRFEEAAGRLAGFTRTIADEHGRLPLIGDDDGGMLWPMTGRPSDDVRDSLAVAAVVLGKPELAAWGVPEEALWIAGPRAGLLPTTLSTPRSCLLRETGYFVARDAGRSHAVVDAGPHGYQNGGHAHADALSLTLSIDGRPLLIDPGTSTYTMDAALRDRMRSTASHNTVTLDGRPQSLPDGPFHWRSTVDARVVACRINPAFDVFEAEHDGYLPARHRRTVVRTSDAGFLIVDAILDLEHKSATETRRHGGQESSPPRLRASVATCRHSAVARWHFDPAWQVTASDRRLRATHGDGASVWMLCDGGEVTVVRGEEGGDGWCAPVYGQLVPATTARVNATAEAPLVLVTWIGSGGEFRSPTLRCTQMNDPGAGVIVHVEDGARTATFLVRSADPARARTVCRVGEFETDAAMFHYVTANGRLQSLSMIDAQHAVSSHDEWPSLAADAPVPDVHLVVRHGEIDWRAAEAAGALTVHGTAGLHIAPGERTRITT
ncbi:MAG TPA: alginate lyase family protein [Vicinamibacterales bacterium]|nr:alginate lyase family protein [Vicinamibacterales bacterium]